MTNHDFPMKRGRPKITDKAQVELPLGWLHLVAASQGSPGEFLDPRKEGGIWRYRFTVIDVSERKAVGRRIRLSLKTRCKAEAEHRREIVATGLAKAGLIVHVKGTRGLVRDGDPDFVDEEIWGPAELADILRRRREAELAALPPANPEASLFANRPPI